ncbi:hypothetical protein AB4331_11180 [Vibrio breoganii]
MNRILPMLLCLSLIGCSSNSAPEWYYQSGTFAQDKIIGVGQGLSLTQAKKKALNSINEILWTEVDSSFSIRESERRINDKANTQSHLDSRINTKTTKISFSGVTYVKSEKHGKSYFVQASIGNKELINQLELDISEYEKEAENQIKNLSHQDKLLWWLGNNDAQERLHNASIRLAMLKSLDPNNSINITSAHLLLEMVSQTKSQIVIQVIPSYKDKRSASFVAEQITRTGLSTSTTKTNLVTHILGMKSEYRNKKVGDAYIATKLTNVELTNLSGTVIANNEVISSSNSITNFEFANEGAERHFSKQIEQQGIWKAIGIKL